MDIKENIKVRLREIEVYRSHGLVEEAKGKCLTLANLIRKSERIENSQELLEFLAKKTDELEKDAFKIGEEAASAQMTTKEQDLVKKLFVFSKEKGTDSVEMEGAVALLIFGQFEKAIVEFEKLLNNDSHGLIAAKNILRCYVALSAFDDAVSQYNQWVSNDQFSTEGLERLHSFLHGILVKRGLEKRLLKSKASAVAEATGTTAEESIDILAIKIPIVEGSEKEKQIYLDVSYQEGNLISVIFPKSHQALINNFKEGMRIDRVQFYSQAVLFNDSCVVSSKSKINSGPKKGNFVIVLQMLTV